MRRANAVESATLALALAALCAPSLALADVLEIGRDGAGWIAGGPTGAAAEFVSTQPTAQVPVTANMPMTHAADAAGPAQWQPHVARIAAKYDISPALLEAVVWQESRWRTNAVSPVGARGLAQLMPGTARQMGVNPDDPIANLEGGARYLRIQLNAFGGDIEKALAAYNAGPARVQRAGGVPRIRETQNYVAAILARLADPVRR